MKRREPNSLPDEILQEFQNGTSDSRSKALRVWELLGNAEQDPLNIPSTEDALKDLESIIDGPSVDRRRAADRVPRRLNRTRSFRTSILAMAAASVVILFSFGAYFSLPAEFSTTAGEQMSVMLPDGSEVQLNNDSSIKYNRHFRTWYGGRSANRSISLEGEAFFTVAKNGQPFKVETFNSTITVLGTGFNVRAYSEDLEKETRITLDHGMVQVDISNEMDTVEEPLILDSTGQQVIVKASNAVKMDIGSDENTLSLATAWRTNGFVAMGLSAESLFKQIERYYNVELTLSDGLLPEPMDLFYRDKEPSIEQVLTDFCISEGCSYQKTASGYMLLPVR